MKLHRIISRALVPALALLSGLAVLLPATALAGGPLLSGYGPPGAGAQSIIGATLLNGPGGGSSGGSGGGTSGNFAGGAGGGQGGSGSGGGLASPSNGAAPSAGTRAAGSPASRGGAGARGVDAHPANGADRSGGIGPGTSAGRSGTYASSSPLGASTAAAIGAAPWFSGGDLLALALAAGVLALIAVTTVRLAGTHHD
jgi:hypothetical protein